jgi:hypothetical protein
MHPPLSSSWALVGVVRSCIAVAEVGSIGWAVVVRGRGWESESESAMALTK